MKSVFAILLFAALSSSCSKSSNDLVYIRFENTSQTTLSDVSIVYYFSAGKYLVTKLDIGNIHPGEITPYIGFEKLSCNASIPLVGLEGNINGETFQMNGICGVGTYTLKNGHYTTELIVSNNTAYLMVKR